MRQSNVGIDIQLAPLDSDLSKRIGKYLEDGDNLKENKAKNDPSIDPKKNKARKGSK